VPARARGSRKKGQFGQREKEATVPFFCLFFGCAGAATGVLSQGLLFQSFSAVTWLFVAAGFVAGLTYWFIAGRQAGQDRQMSGDPA